MSKGLEPKLYNEYQRMRANNLDLFSFDSLYKSKKEDYSNTVELYDVLPKYIHDDVAKLRTADGLLKSLTREFVFKKQEMSLTITPALVKTKDGEKAFYPSTREEIIEDVLRKFATDPNRNEFLDDRLSVKFSLYDLWKELRRIKHPYDYDQIKESLDVLLNTSIKITTKNNKQAFSSHMIETFGVVDYNDNTQIEYDENYSKKIIYFVRFNSLVSESVKNKTWRIINYKQCMSYKRMISRWLHKRISHMFLVGDIEIPYSILLSTIIRDSGMTKSSLVSDNIKRVGKCLEEMIEVGSIDRYDIEKICDEHKKNKIMDVKFSLYISKSFYKDIQLGFLAKRYNQEQQIQDDNDYDLKVMNSMEIDNANTTTILNSEADTKIQTEIIKLLAYLNISQKDINKVLSSKKNQKNLEQVRNNIITAKNYIEKKQKNNEEEECNNIAIVLASIKDNWCDNKTDEEITIINNKTTKIKHNTKTEEETEEDKIQQNLQTAKDYIKTEIKDKVFKKISNNLLKNFGPNIYLVWLSNLKFVEIKDDTLILSCVNGFIIDEIKRLYLKGTYKTEPDNTITWLRKGIKEIVEEIEPEIKKIEIIKVEK